MIGGSESGGWRKSSFSGTGNCVEARYDGDRVHLRHSQMQAIELVFTRAEWLAFTNGVQVGEFDLPEH